MTSPLPSADARVVAAAAHARLVARKGADHARAQLADCGAEVLPDLPDGKLKHFTSVALLEADGRLHIEDDDQGQTVFLVGGRPLGPEPGPELRTAQNALLRLALTHPEGERAVAAVLASVGVETLTTLPDDRMQEVVLLAALQEGAAGAVWH